MSDVLLQLEDELVALLGQLNQPVQRSARELIIIELYRRGSISDGKAAQLLEMSRLEFVRYASKLGQPYFSLSPAEWAEEVAHSHKL